MEIKIIINEAGTSRRSGKVGFEGRGEGRRAAHRHHRPEGGERRAGGRWGCRAEGRHGEGRWSHRAEGGQGEGRWGHRMSSHGEGRWGAAEPQAERPRVIGKVVEMPDGSVRVIRRPEREGEPRGERRHRHGGHRGMGHGMGHGKHEGRRGHGRHGHRAEHGRAERPHSDEARQAQRARRQLAREIVRALEESGYGNIEKA